MKITTSLSAAGLVPMVGLFSVLLAVTAPAQNAKTAGKEPVEPVQPVPAAPLHTGMDMPNSFHKYYGQRINNWRDSERTVAKVDLDSDLNLDGVINNNDPQDGGAFEGTPPGLQIGKGEMSKVVIRVIPYRVDFDGEVVVTLELDGINRNVNSGEFESFEQEQAMTGRVRIWREASRKTLLLDSADPGRRYVEFSSQYRVYPYNLPNEIPRVVYVEGVKPSPQHTGDLRLLLTCSHRAPGSDPKTFAESRKTLLKSFRTSFDHLLFTILPAPMPKEFVNNNVEANWVKVGAK